MSKFRATTIAIAVSAAGYSAASLSNDLEEVVVTAQKRSQAISEVPTSIQAINEYGLENSNITQVRYLAEATPKLTTASNFGQFATILSGRGLSASTGFDPVVASYVDDVPYAYAGQGWAPTSNLYDIDRVEILGGPQGTLWGQGSMAGTVRILTNDPTTEEFEANIDLSVASVADGEMDYSYSGMVNIPIVEDVLAARLTYSTTKLGGFLDYPNMVGGAVEDGNDADYEDIRAKVLWTPTDRLSVKATYWESEVESQIADRIAVIPGVPNEDLRADPTAVALGVGTTESDALSVTINYEFDNFEIVNTYSKLEATQEQVALAGGIDGFADPDSDTTSNEIRLVSNLEGPIQFIVGHYYQDSDTSASIRVRGFDPLIPGVPFENRLFFGYDRWDLTSEVSSFFGEVSMEMMDGKMEVTLGVRDFEDDRSYVQFSDVPFVEGDGFIELTPLTEETFDSTNYRFNVKYQLSDDVMMFFNSASGFRSGNFNAGISVAAAAGAGFDQDIRAIQPDEVISHDFGLKGDFADGRLSAELVYFMSEWEDAQQGVGLPNTGFFTTLFNAGDMDINGLEYNFTLRATDSLTLNLQGTWLDTEWTRVTDGLAEVSLLEEGGEALGTPDNQYILSGTYTRPMNVFGKNLDFTAYGAYQYHGEKSDAIGNQIAPGVGAVNDSYKRLNARFTLAETDNWEASLYIDNLTDEDDTIAMAFGTIGTVPRPRQIGLTYRKYF